MTTKKKATPPAQQEKRALTALARALQQCFAAGVLTTADTAEIGELTSRLAAGAPVNLTLRVTVDKEPKP